MTTKPLEIPGSAVPTERIASMNHILGGGDEAEIRSSLERYSARRGLRRGHGGHAAEALVLLEDVPTTSSAHHWLPDRDGSRYWATFTAGGRAAARGSSYQATAPSKPPSSHQAGPTNFLEKPLSLERTSLWLKNAAKPAECALKTWIQRQLVSGSVLTAIGSVKALRPDSLMAPTKAGSDLRESRHWQD